MRLPFAGGQVALFYAAVLAALAALLLSAGTLTWFDEDHEPVPTPSPSPSPSVEPWWDDPRHPPRTAEVRVRIERRNGADGEPLQVVAQVEHDLVLQAEDPLLPLVAEGSVTGSDLVARVIGGTAAATGRPTVERGPGGPAHVRFPGVAYAGLVEYDGERVRMSFPLEIGDDSTRDPRPSPSSVVSRRTLIVEAGDAEVVAVSGASVVRQSPTTVRLEGPPGTARITVEAAQKGPVGSVVVPSPGPFDGFLLSRSGVVFATGIVLLGPWLLLLLVWWRARRDGGAVAVGWGAARLVVSVGTLILLFGYDGTGPLRDSLLVGVTVVFAVLLLASRARLLRGLPPWDPGQHRRLLLGCLLLAVVVGAVSPTVRYVYLVPSVAELLGYLAVIASAAALARALRASVWRGVATGVAVVLLVATASALREDDVDVASVYHLSLAVSFGLLCAFLADPAWGPDRPAGFDAGRRVLLYVGGAVSFLPILALASDGYGGLERPVVAAVFGGLTTATALLGVALVVVAVAALRRRGDRAEALDDIVVWGLALASLVVLAVEHNDLVQFNALAVAALLASWWLLLPRRRGPAAVARAAVGPAAHTALVKAEMRRRLMELSAHDVYRSARALLRDGSVGIREYERRQHRIDQAAAARGRTVAGLPVSDALATAGGRPPADGAVAAVGYATPLVVLVVGYEVWALLVAEPGLFLERPVWQVAVVVIHILRWFAYAAVYGYFYALIRGRTPVAKAMALVLLVLPAELLTVLSSVSPRTDWAGETSITTAGELFLALAIRAGQVVVFCVVLGLAWERRLAALAGYRWDRLRNIRSVRALATPAGTVLVAVATALGTAVASTAVAALLTSGSPAPTPQSTLSPSPSVTKEAVR
ncbi:hypothetical protein ACIBXA_25720 [Micromonospora echinaurantiaca]|uniref:hypothetical protein n=1 Tax=Micromonospora echinaurantiaca TaxID=47857 RepID=UPI0037B1D1F0